MIILKDCIVLEHKPLRGYSVKFNRDSDTLKMLLLSEILFLLFISTVKMYYIYLHLKDIMIVLKNFLWLCL